MKFKENFRGKDRGGKKSVNLSFSRYSGAFHRTALRSKDAIAIAAAVSVLAFVLSACAGRNETGINRMWLYTLKAADGSGQVAVYNGARISSNKINTVPDGTEMEAVNGEVTRGLTQMLYQGQRVYVRKADISGEGTPTEAAKEVAQEAEKIAAGSKTINTVIGLIVLAILAAGCFVFNKKVKMKFADYYAEKRKAYPWLQKWIEEHGDPEEPRARSRLWSARLLPIAAALIAFVAGKLLLSRIILLFIKEGSVFHNTTTISWIITAVLTLIAFWYANRGVGKPEDETSGYYELTLECPECGCPHAWALTSHNIVLTNVDLNIESETTTTTRRAYRGDDLVESALDMFRKTGTTTKSTSTKHTKYEGIETRDFVCDNCNHTHHAEARFYEFDKKKINVVDGFCFDKESPFLKGGATNSTEKSLVAQFNLAKWADDFAATVKAKGAKAGLPAGEIAELLERTAEYTGTYESMEYLDSEAAGEYYRSYIREFISRNLREAPDDVRAVFGILPGIRLYAWKVDDKAAEAGKK